ncbi:hypothetical protein M9435_003949 [Picochlorum sp. BPE23]|nr:hypothetical protein M9435_003949 [Picochlorum sp. BPE23]
MNGRERKVVQESSECPHYSSEAGRTNGLDGLVENLSLREDHGGSDAKEEENGTLPCDEVLYNALCSYRHRNRIIDIEKQVEEFVVELDEEEMRFEENGTTFERLLVHRTAQHWGLATRVAQGGEGAHSCIIASRQGGAMERPEVVLRDLKVTMEGPTQQHHHHRQPRILTRGQQQQQGQQHYRGPPRHADDYHQNGYGPREDREEMYERARARIFGGYGGDVMQQGMIPIMPYPYGIPQQQQNGEYLEQQGKARIRNKSNDMADPDFMRSKPYEVYVQQPMYPAPPAEYMNGQQPMPPNVVSYPMAYGYAGAPTFAQYPMPMPYGVVPVGPDGMVLAPPYPGMQMPPMQGGYRRPGRHPGRHYYRGGGRRGRQHRQQQHEEHDDGAEEQQGPAQNGNLEDQ